MNIPKLRFKGFNDEWCKKYLKDIGNTYTGLTGKTKEDFGHGKAHFITFLNVLTNPITDKSMLDKIEIDNKQHQVQKGDVFFNTSSETPEEVGMSSVWDFTDDNIYLNSFCFAYRPFIKFNNYFLAYNLRSPLMRKKIRLLAQGISRYNISKNKLMEKMIYYPSLSEQQKIGSLFAKLDNLIDLQAKKLELLKQLKQGLLQKLFPQNNQTTPQLRFKGFNDEWQTIKLNNVYIKSKEKNTQLAFNKKQIISVANMHFNNDIDEINSTSEYMKTYNVMHLGDIAFEGHVSKNFFDGRFVLNDIGDGIVSHIFEVFSPITKYDITFMKHYIHNERVMHNILLHSTIKTLMMNTLNSKEFLQQTILLPTLQEQQKIGSLLANLDKLLINTQEKLTLFKQVKKYLLQRMFI